MTTITNKEVQIHFECICGFNAVYQDTFPIKWSDLPKNGVVRKMDKKTGKPFLLKKEKSDQHYSHEEF